MDLQGGYTCRVCGVQGEGEFHWLLEFLPVVTSNIGQMKALLDA